MSEDPCYDIPEIEEIEKDHHKNLRERLRNLYHIHPTARSFFSCVYTHRLCARSTRLAMFIKQLNKKPSEVIELFRKFDDIGLGKFIIGRRGSKTRFVWYYDIRSLAEVAIGGTDQIRDVPEDAPDDKDEEEECIKHSFNLRPDFIVEMWLPKSVTKHEIERMIIFMRSLPF